MKRSESKATDATVQLGGQFEEAKVELAALLPGRERLTERLAWAVLLGEGLAMEEASWQSDEGRRLRRAAKQLMGAAASLKRWGWQTVEEMFNAASVNIFRGYRLPPEVANYLRAEFGVDYADKRYWTRFLTQVHLLANAGVRHVGRQREEMRSRVAVEVAKLLLQDGILPGKGNSGVFANALRIVLKRAGLAPPADMYRITAEAMRKIAELKKWDRELAEAVRDAKPLDAAEGRDGSARRVSS